MNQVFVSLIDKKDFISLIQELKGDESLFEGLDLSADQSRSPLSRFWSFLDMDDHIRIWKSLDIELQEEIICSTDIYLSLVQQIQLLNTLSTQDLQEFWQELEGNK